MFQNKAGVRVLAAALGLAAASLPAAGIAAPAWATTKADAGPSNVAAAPHEVAIEDFAFGPKILTVSPGTKVTWINRDAEPHTVLNSAETPLFRSPPLDTGDTFSFTFTQPGAYPYYCSVHPHMTGTVVVQ